METTFVAGGTGYMGGQLLRELLQRGPAVRALCASWIRGKASPGCETVMGDALDGSTYAAAVKGCSTFVHLVGVAHPSPAESKQFREIDLVAARSAIQAAAQASIERFVYLSVAHPAPIMKVCIEVRSKAEKMLHASGMNATILRPWYVLGPGHRWPYALIPVYWLFEKIPATRSGAERFGLVILGR
jgi:nucleoside-diphosphate-sugar epimerase